MPRLTVVPVMDGTRCQVGPSIDVDIAQEDAEALRVAAAEQRESDYDDAH